MSAEKGEIDRKKGSKARPLFRGEREAVIILRWSPQKILLNMGRVK